MCLPYFSTCKGTSNYTKVQMYCNKNAIILLKTPKSGYLCKMMGIFLIALGKYFFA